MKVKAHLLGCNGMVLATMIPDADYRPWDIANTLLLHAFQDNALMEGIEHCEHGFELTNGMRIVFEVFNPLKVW